MDNHCTVTTLIGLNLFTIKIGEEVKEQRKEKVIQITYRSKNKSRKYLELCHNETTNLYP